MNRIIRIFSLILAMVLLLALCACTSKKVSTEQNVYITVNGEQLSKEYIGYFFSLAQESMLSEAGYTPENSDQKDIDIYWETTELEGKDAVEVARDIAVNNAVMQKVSYQKAKEEGIILSDDEIAYINADLKSVADANGGDDAFGKLLSARGTDVIAYKQILTENMYMEKLFDKYDSEGVFVFTDDEIAQFSEANAEKYTADSMLYEMKKQKFNEISLSWEKEADIVINDEKINEFDV